MRYSESREQTVALVRQVLSQMGEHNAAFNPCTFAVFYEHAAGINRRLSDAFRQMVAGSTRLDDAAVCRLYQDFVADVGIEEAERVRAGMQREMTSIMESASRTGQVAGTFDEQLSGLSGALASTDTRALGERIDVALAGTQEMRDSVQALQQQVRRSQGEIEKLRADLLRTRQEATMCPLTRVLNRRGFEECLDAMLCSPLPKGASHCLILLDIDHFKRVNDTYGHPVGDRVIEGLGEVLRSVPPEPGMACARYGGEEFAILLPSSSVKKAVQVAEAVRSRMQGLRLRNRATNQVQFTVTVSAGVAAWQPGEDAQALLSCADAALYRSKENGRDRVTVA